MEKVRAKKHLGQHFLTEASVATNLARAITGHRNTSNVLEIGPGTGILTRALTEADHAHLKMVEIDTESVAYLKKRHPELEGRIIEGDFLKLPLEGLFNKEPFVLAGNFPYNISSQILFRVVDNHEMIPEMVGMFQREVARRIASPPGSKEYGILSVLVQVYYDVEYLFTVDEGCFSPPPKVKSGVIRLARNDRKVLPVSDSFFKHVVKTAFGQRRKTLRNSLSPFTGNISTPMDPELMALRPERLSPETFIELAAKLSPDINSDGPSGNQ